MTRMLLSKAGLAVLIGIGGMMAIAIRSADRDVDDYDPWAVD